MSSYVLTAAREFIWTGSLNKLTEFVVRLMPNFFWKKAIRIELNKLY